MGKQSWLFLSRTRSVSIEAPHGSWSKTSDEEQESAVGTCIACPRQIMDTLKQNDTETMRTRDNSATPTHHQQVVAETLSGNTPTASTETLGRNRANADDIVTGGTNLSKPRFQTNDQVSRISNWLWNVDRPWEGFKQSNSSDSKIVRDKTENNIMAQAKQGAMTPPRK
ncbi:hypothetical protein SNK03_012491 [Fusarium graminearum]